MSQLVFIKRARATMDANEKGRWINHGVGESCPPRKEIEEGLKSGRYAVCKDKGFGKTYSDGDRYKD